MSMLARRPLTRILLAKDPTQTEALLRRRDTVIKMPVPGSTEALLRLKDTVIRMPVSVQAQARPRLRDIAIRTLEDLTQTELLLRLRGTAIETLV